MSMPRQLVPENQAWLKRRGQVWIAGEHANGKSVASAGFAIDATNVEVAAWGHLFALFHRQGHRVSNFAAGGDCASVELHLNILRDEITQVDHGFDLHGLPDFEV